MKRVLVDRHHASLFHSLQLLFEDRLGMLVYTPVGHEWWDNAYWRFGEGYGDDRLARQFLQWDLTSLGAEQRPGYQNYVTRDPHYPEREIMGVNLGAVKATAPEWTHVVATVQDNQAGFARLARELDAEFVLQVGNVNQVVDWRLDPLALIANDIPIVGRGVKYHPEFRAEYSEPVSTTEVRSFVNCFARTECYPLVERSGLPVTVHGIDGDNVQSVDAIHDLMARSGWGWHDKVQGDGYGFVIFGWAAVGRPLIGHASHYRGLMAEPFWEDGVTCIDLDKHSPEEAAAVVRNISPDAHRAMCEATRARFDAMVDFDAEADAVAAALGVSLPAGWPALVPA